MKILVTGATGNVGQAILHRLDAEAVELFAGVRDLSTARARLGVDCQACVVDFEKAIFPTIPFDAVFLMRPPQLADPALFATFLSTLEPSTRVVFLSVQGADTKSYLPHAKIEKLIREMGLPHVFLRPSYFMENLTTTLWPELAANRRIFLPSGKLRLNWIAVSDVAEVGALALLGRVAEDAADVSNTGTLGFQEVVDAINALCATRLAYHSPWLPTYVAYTLRQHQGLAYLFVMLLLHYLPRFSRQDGAITSDFQRITGKPPITLDAFIAQNRSTFEQLR
ncbi:MAG: NmrA family NAD(P)-binding protein [Caldilineaceae bacterium]|nr:NmrA family NAD(P)-binding protein [Caldilineaceae bacterium]MBP8106152.1 NmrA family NAD(P)-binding protein [Caldilineaceae bacterium]MBP8122270.1 NmrA family NAD(P)-binding protein [Caldilineaceae bacterium]